VDTILPEGPPETPPAGKSRSLLKHIIISNTEPRLRAGWRLLVHAIVHNLLLLVITLPAILPALLLGIAPDNIYLSQIISLLATTSSVCLARRYLDRRPIASLGMDLSSRTITDLIGGFFIAGFSMGIIFLIEISAGWIDIEFLAWEQETIPAVYRNMQGASNLIPLLHGLASTFSWLFLFTLVGWNEELLFRGYRLQALSDGLTPFWGVLLSSVWFCAAHWLNPHASWSSSLGILLAGLFLAFSFYRSGQLWLPVGLHIGWNFFQGVVFGFPVSGLTTFRLIHTNLTGPVLWTGGDFGPEAGLALLPAVATGSALVYLITRHRQTRRRDSG